MYSESVTPVEAAEAADGRLRRIGTLTELREHPPTAAELRRRAVVVDAAAAGDGATLDTVPALFPWMEVWRDHVSYATGVWRCSVDEHEDDPLYTAYEARHLDFHTDMTRYLRPPEFTVIRCIARAVAGGANLVVHVDDLFAELERRARTDLIAVLGEPRTLNMDERHRNVPGAGERASGVLAVPGRPDVPSRIFDPTAATKAMHLDMSDADIARYEEFRQLCDELDNLSRRALLARHDVLAFSNWRFLHARTACAGGRRVTEISMGNERSR